MTLGQRSRAILDRLDRDELRRAIVVRDGLVDFASNDYLGLAHDPDVVAAMRGATVVGSTGARLLSGAHREHAALESELAAFVRRERCLVFSSGYLAALGAIHGLAQIVRTAYSDALNHASVIDALRLTRLERQVFAHGALPAAAARNGPALIVTESVFGMTGEVPDLGATLRSLGEEDVLLLDEAHALGVIGPGGAGVASGFDDPRIVVLGTLSKAFGCAGGFVAGPADFIELLISTARSFIFDTSLPPPIVSAARAALRRIIAGDDLRRRLFDHVGRVDDAFRSFGLCAPVRSPILSIVLGSAHRALALSARLRAGGLYVPAIRPPTVAAGTSRLRVTLRADHRREDVERLCSGVARAIDGAVSR